MTVVRDQIRIEVETFIAGLADPQPQDVFDLLVDYSNVDGGIGEFGEGGEIEAALEESEKPYRDDDDNDSDDSDCNDDRDEGDDGDDDGNDGADGLGLRPPSARGGGAPPGDGGGAPSVHSDESKADTGPGAGDQGAGKCKSRFEEDLHTLSVLQGIAREMNDKATLIMLENQTGKLRRQLRRGDVADRAVAEGFLTDYKACGRETRVCQAGGQGQSESETG